MTTLIISKKEVDDIIKTIEFLKESSLLIKVVSKAIHNEVKEQKGEFLSSSLEFLRHIKC